MWPAVAVLACALGMGSKEAMVTAPLVIVLFDRVFLFDSFSAAFARRWRLYAGLASAWIILALLLSTQPRPLSAGFSTDVSPWTYLLNQPSLITRYLALTVWPSSLVANYGWPVEVPFRTAFPYLLLIGALAVAVIAALKRCPALGFLGAWFFITLAPASSFVPVATEVGAERRMYLPLASLVVLAVVGVTLAWDRLIRTRPDLARVGRTAWIASGVLLLGVSTAFAVTTMSRNREYASRIGLARITVERYPTPSAHHVLAEYLLQEGQRAEAMQHLRQALPGAPRAHYTLGVELYREGRLDEAISEFRAFIEKQPRLVHVIEAYGYLGKSYAAQGNWPGAIEAFRALLRITPDNPVADHSLADVLFAAGRVAESIPHYRTYLAEYSSDVDALNQLGMALASTGKLDEAAATFLRAERVDGNNATVQHNLATVFWNLNDRDAALEHARRALALQPDNVETRKLVETLTGR